jgi:S-DNA-T family DNA segregation ATPase FtsK/SpoIIIE
LLDAPDARQQVDASEIEENKRLLLDKLETYNIEITSIHAVIGPTVTRYELTPAPGVKISRITALEDDLAMALAAPGIRIIAPIPGKSAIGVEIPNRSRELVRLRQMLGTARFRDASPRGGAGGHGAMALPIPIGKAIEGEVFLEDLARMPHLLIAGATGSGKSVGLNTLIVALLYACHPSDLKFVLVDPKKIELNLYATLLDHFIAMPEDVEEPITTDFAVAAGVLRSCEREMERRYDRLAEAGVRGLKEYNEKVRSGSLSADDGHGHLPYIVVVIDELADLMMTSGKEVEAPIARLAQMARAVGIHLVIATQRPSVDVITGLIKANFPSRIAYQVASRVDSRTILDQGGAHQLVGNGDLLYMNGSRITRLQGPFLSVEEVERVTRDIARQPGHGPYLLPPLELGEGPAFTAPRGGDDGEGRDDLFEDAARAIVRSQTGSVSLLQRKLSIGYTRAARIVDQLEDAGIVGPTEGSRPRQVLISSDMQLDDVLRSLGTADG